MPSNNFQLTSSNDQPHLNPIADLRNQAVKQNKLSVALSLFAGWVAKGVCTAKEHVWEGQQ